ncbi:cytochrome c oxidase assembly protein [Oceanicola sp. 502str15]|uniref:cytochrome c oxidase assembly protein n=1 Tax=Oceanicola sp. 502str15 TaxID=2696061 RepID=UPI002094A294|nr:cytochrome c oxidase assembly protein [Oceanicola sp. 502str15]MCO6383095.1 cytochrome c oxidase assembly protein [Oceanicola sp. 502str15]
MSDPDRQQNPKNARVALYAAGVVVFMGAMAWVAVPFYNWFCKVTGYGGTTSVAEGSSDVVLDREITVRFDANTDLDMPWQFKPMQQKMVLKIGETGLAFYEAYNPTDRPIAGQASYNVAPFIAGGYFDKIDCFCFTEQVLQPGERVQMPVSFYVDPEIVNDRDAKFTNSITLSYTFYEIDLPEEQAALSPDAPDTAPKAN